MTGRNARRSPGGGASDQKNSTRPATRAHVLARRQASRKPRTEIEALREQLLSVARCQPEADQTERGRAEQAAREAYNRSWQIYKVRLDDPEARTLHEQAVKQWRAALGRLYSPEFEKAYGLVRDADPAGLETTIRFLEEDPICFRSGYIKADLLRFITRFDMSAQDAARLRSVILSVVDRRDGREFRAYCRLARKLDSAELRQELARRLAHTDANVRRRAAWVLAACEQPR